MSDIKKRSVPTPVIKSSLFTIPNKTLTISPVAPQIDQQSNSIKFLALTKFYTICYYVGVASFKPIQEGQNLWTLVTSKVQKIMSIALVWMPVCIYWTTELVHLLMRFARYEKLRPRNYFTIIDILLTCTKLSTFFWITTKRRPNIERMLNMELKGGKMRTPLEFPKTRTGNRELVHLLLSTFSSLSVFLFVAVVKLPGASHVDSLRTLYDQLAINGKKRFNPKYDGSVVDNLVEIYVYGTFFWAVVELLFMLSKFVVSSLVDTFFMGVLPVVLTEALQDFECATNLIMASASIPFTEKLRLITDKFRQLRKFSNVANSIWAKSVLIWSVGHCLFKIYLLNQALLTQSTFYFGVIVFAIIVWAKSLAFYAEIYEKMTSMQLKLLRTESRRKWNYRNHNKTLLDKLIEHMEGECVGISSDGIFRLNFSFTAQLAAFIVTIFLVDTF